MPAPHFVAHNHSIDIGTHFLITAVASEAEPPVQGTATPRGHSARSLPHHALDAGINPTSAAAMPESLKHRRRLAVVKRPKHRRDDFRVTMLNRGSTCQDGARPSRFDPRLSQPPRRRPPAPARIRCMDGAYDVHTLCMPSRRSRPAAFRARSAPCPAPSTKVNARAGQSRSSSLIPVFDRVRSSTRLTMTAQ